MPGSALDAVVNRFTGKRLVTCYPCPNARKINANFGPNLTIASGTVVGQAASVSVNDVQTMTLTGTPTGGTFTITVTPYGNPLTTAALAYNATAAQIQAALVAILGTGNVTVTGTTGPGTAQTITFVGALKAMTIPPMTVSVAALTGGTPAYTMVHTTPGVSPNGYIVYAGTALVGLGFLEYDIVTDAAGNVFLGSQASMPHGESQTYAPVYISGDFDTRDLTGFDATALAAMFGNLLNGTVTAGVVHIP